LSGHLSNVRELVPGPWSVWYICCCSD